MPAGLTSSPPRAVTMAGLTLADDLVNFRREMTNLPAIDQAAVLLTASCTTGVTDWIHGELWLCPDGLLRRALGLFTTVRHGLGPTVDAANRPRRTFVPSEITSILASNRRNMWIPRDAVSAARLEGSPLPQVTLTLDLRDGRTQKLLWLPSDQVPQGLLDGWVRAESSPSE